MAHSILARKCKENKDMEDKIKALTEELETLHVKEAAAERRLAELRAANAEKVAAERDGGIKLKSAKCKSFVTAKTARETAETTCAFKNHIAKFIDEEAKEGRIELHYCTYGICEIQVDTVTSELTDLGYKVEFSSENQELTIKW
jgi:hypothetical protein